MSVIAIFFHSCYLFFINFIFSVFWRGRGGSEWCVCRIFFYEEAVTQTCTYARYVEGDCQSRGILVKTDRNIGALMATP
jgi:hypothetical protein